MNDDIDKLYQNLLDNGYEIEGANDAATFRKKMSNKQNRKALYDVVTEAGDDLGDYDSFESNLSSIYAAQQSNTVQQQPKAQTAAKPTATAKRPQVFRLRAGGKDFNVSTDAVKEAGGLTNWARANGYDNDVRVYMHGTDENGKKFDGHVQLSQAHNRRKDKGYKYSLYDDTPLTDEQRRKMAGQVAGMQVRQNNADLYRSKKPQNTKIGLNVPNTPIGQEPQSVLGSTDRLAFGSDDYVEKTNIDPTTGKTYKTYVTADGSEYGTQFEAGQAAKAREDRANAMQKYLSYNTLQRLANADESEKPQIFDTLVEQLESEAERLGKMYQQRQNELQATNRYMPGLAYQASINADQKLKQIEAAMRNNQEALRVLKDNRDGNLNEFWHNLGTEMQTGYFMNMGVNEMRDSGAMTNAKRQIEAINQKRERGEELTPQEELSETLLISDMVKNGVSEQYGNYGAWGNAGKMTTNSIDFMTSILATPNAAGVAKWGTAAVTKGLTKIAPKFIPKLVLKATGVTVGAGVAGAYISNTGGLTRTMADLSDNMNGVPTLDENGKIVMEDAMSFGKSLWEAERSNIRENTSEMVGEFLPGVGAVASKLGLGKLGSKIANSQIGNKLRLDRIAPALTKIGKKRWYKMYQGLLHAGGYNGIPGEALEEYAGYYYDFISGHGDEAWKELKDKDTHINIWLGCATTGALLGAIPFAGQVGHTANYFRVEHNMNKASKKAGVLFGDEWDVIREEIDNAPNEVLPSVVNIALTNKTEEQRKAIVDYVSNYVKYRAYNIAAGDNAYDEDAEEAEREAVDKGFTSRAQQQELTESLNGSYRNGYEATTPEQMNAAKTKMEMLQEKAVSIVGDETLLSQIENNLSDELGIIISAPNWTEEEKSALLDYLNAKQTYDGMIQRVKDDIDDQIAQSDAMIDSRVNHAAGGIVAARMKQDKRPVYVVSGRLSHYDDGTGVSVQYSDESVVVRDAETGQLEIVSSADVLDFDDPIFADEEKAAAAEAIRQEIAQRKAGEIDGKVNFVPGQVYHGLNENGLPLDFALLDDGTGNPLLDETGTQYMVQMGNSTIPLTAEQLQQLVDNANRARAAQDLAAQQSDEQAAATEQRIAEARETATSHQFEAGETIMLTDDEGNPVEADVMGVGVDGVEIQARDGRRINGNVVQVVETATLREMMANTATAQIQAEAEASGSEEAPSAQPQAPDANATGQQTALAQIEKDENGEPLYEGSESGLAWDALVEQAEGDAELAAEVATDRVSELEADVKSAEKELKKLQEGKPEKRKDGTSPTMAERIAAKKAAKDAIAGAQARLDEANARLNAWKQIADTPNRRRKDAERAQREAEAAEAAARRETEAQARAEAEEAARIEREALNGVPDVVDDTPQNARARGYRRVNGHKIDRQAPIETAARGKSVEVKFADDVLAAGTVAVIEADQLQPSHANGQRNPYFFIDEAQPKARTDQASVASAEKMAGSIRPEEITTSVTAFTGAPSVNERGEAIQGNNRSSALKLMWETQPEQAAKYKQYLMEHAAEFGLAPEAIEAMEKPVLVNMLSVDDATAINLGQYVAQDTESGGDERIKAKNVVQKIGNDMKTFANILLNSADEEASFSSLLDANGVEVLKWMNQKGYITPTQFKSAFDSKGNLTGEAKNDLKGIMYQSIFTGGDTRLEEMFGAMPAKAQKAILATAYRDFDSPGSERMVEEIQNSIRAYHALSSDEAFVSAKNYKEARAAVEMWKRQYVFDDVTGDSYLPSGKFSNFALHLATIYRGESQGFIQGTFNHLYDLIQGTQEATLFEQPDNTPRTLAQAIQETFNFEYNGQQGSNVLAGNSTASEEGQQGSDGSSETGGRVSEREQPSEREGGTAGNSEQQPEEGNNLSQEDIQAQQVSNFIDPREMSEEERTRRGDMLRNATVIDVDSEQIVATEELSARKAAEKWWDENVSEPAFYATEVGEVEINRNSIEDSLAHRYGQAKLDAITSLIDGFENAVYLGTMPDTNRQEGVYNHYFAYPINYEGERRYVFCRAMQDKNKNRLYVHEVFLGKSIKKGDTLQTAAFQPHGGITLYRQILANVLEYASGGSMDIVPEPQNGEQNGTAPLQDASSESKGNEKSPNTNDLGEKVAEAEAEVNTEPTEAQKEAGNYKKGHVQVGTFNITIENPKGSVRSGVDANGKKWETTMRNTYGYIRGTEGVDGDHIDVFLSDDMDGWNGRRVYVVDQYNPDGTFDEHKVMLGFNDEAEAQDGYFSNYEKGWSESRRLEMTSVNIEDFEKWINSSHRKTKPFAEYKSVKKEEAPAQHIMPRQLAEAYESGDQTAIATAENTMRDFIAGQRNKKKALVSTYFYSKDISTNFKKDSATYKTHNFIANMCKSVLKDAGVDPGVLQKEKARIKLAGSTTNKETLDILSNDPSFNVVEAVIGNPNTSEETLRIIMKAYSYTVLGYEAERALEERGVSEREEQPTLDDNGIPFVKSSDGTDTFGHIGEETGLRAAPIRLSVGTMDYGLKHIEAKHGEQIRNAGYASVQSFVEEVARNYDTIRKGNEYQGNKQTYLVEVSDQKNNTLYVELSKNGDYWNVNSAGIFKKGYSKKKEVVWSLPTVENGASASPVEVAHPSNESRVEGGQSGNSSQTTSSASKVTETALNEQENEDIFAKAARIVREQEEKKQKPKQEETKPKNPSGNKLVSDERYAELRERMRRKLGGQMNLGIDPEILAIGTEMAVYHLEKGGRKFAEYAKGMIEDLGDAIRPYLKAFYNGARELPEVESEGITADMTPYDEVQKFDVANFDKPTTSAIATAQTVVREQEVEKEAQTAKDIIKKTRENRAGREKKAVTSQQNDLFGGLFDNVGQINDNDNGLQGNDAVRSERVQADDSRHEERLSGGTEEESGSREQSRERTDGTGETRSDAVDRSVRPRPSSSVAEPKNTNNNHSERGANHAPISVDARIEANIKAIELARQLIESEEKATPEQMAVLRKFSGWGGLGKAFNEEAQESKRLRELLGEEAYGQAVMSANSSYYTPAYVVDTLWDIAEQMGFEGGNILEGSAGIGNILGQMPTNISERSDIHAIEIDETSGSILSLLYPDANVEIQGFEQTRIPNGSVDLAITNVPFVTGLLVKDTTGDKDLSSKFRNIHDFCIAKNVRKLREGGLGIFITSNGTLDNSKKLRDWIVNEGGSDFIGAFRMNNKTFGGTPVTSDIIVIRKRINGQKSANAIDVSTVTGERMAEYDTGETRRVKGVETPVVKQLSMDYNRYFVEHPENMAGEMHFGFEKGDTYRPTSKGLFPVNGKNQEQMLSEFAQSFKAEEKGDASQQAEDTNSLVLDASADGKRLGEVYVKDGKLVVASFGGYYPLSVNANKVKGHTKVECFNAYAAIKQALADVLSYQTENESDKGLKPLLDKLNKAYDDFVNTYGHFNKNTAIAFLRNDVDFANVFALEKYEETADKDGNRVGKTDVFKMRVVEKDKEPTPTNVKDGIVASLFKFGRIDVPYIAEQLGENEEAVKRDIISNGYGFEDPVTRQMEVSYQYLSGNVREKLRQAEENNENGEYDKNIKALQEALPMDIPAHLIDFTLGSSWVDPKLYEDYAKERTDIDVKFTAVGGTWFMKVPNYGLNKEKNRSMGVVSEQLHKTIMGHTLIEAAIQNRSITVSQTYRHYDGTTETVTDKEATQACAAKIDEIRQDFKEWARQRMQGDSEMSERMERIYNDTFNNYVPMSIPDDFVPEYFGGASHKFKMRPHQGKAIVRGTMQPLLLAHEVGTGKTFTLISTAMEMRRLGTARKPMIVVQNATVGQFVASAKALYPNAKILTLEEADRSAEGRKNFYAKIRYNDWDMIVVPQSTFEFIPDSEERQMAFIKDKIEEKMLVLEQMKEADSDGNNIITRQAEKEIADLELQLAALSDQTSKKRTASDEKKRAVAMQNAEVKAQEMLDRRTDDVENFDEMGIDALLVDEAHEYKHLGFATAMQRGVKGVDPSYSKKSQGVYLKTQAVLEKNNGRNVIFATGTPISNTAAEIWTFMRYLMPADTMKEYGIYYFDDFVRNFGNIQQMLEFTTSGKFKENNRFAGYVNLPELVRIWSGVSDTVLTKEAGGVNDKIPEMETGKAQDLYLPQTRALRGIMKFVKAQLERYENMSGKQKKENSHIPLTMYGIAKAAAVDARLVQSEAEDDPNSKTNEAVRQTLRSLKETESYKGTVAIFADNYQNKHSGFNLYEDIREKLIAQGVPSEQIVVMKSGMNIKKKLDIFDKVNRGEVRVILGSTFTLGTGVNIQERLHTLIHLDAPNRPMDYTQRNGRILRQGNLHKDMNKPVRVLRFGVEDSLDVTAYQRLKTKGAIADSIMNGKQMMSNSMSNRVLEEEEDVFGDTVAQLSGSEYAMLKNNAEKNVRKYESRKKQWEADQTYIHNAKPRLRGLIAEAEKRKAQNDKYLKAVKEAFKDGKFDEIVIGKNHFATVDSMADFFKEQNKAALAVAKSMKDDSTTEKQKRELSVSLGNYTFKVRTEFSREMAMSGASLFAEVHRKMTYSCPELGLEDVPVKQSLLRNAIEDITENVITGKDFADFSEAAERSIKHSQSELEQILSRDGKPFEFDKELAQAQEQLEEYTELMKKELAEKEAKYAEMDAEVQAAENLSDTEADDDVLYRDGETKRLRNGRNIMFTRSTPTNTFKAMEKFVDGLGERAQYTDAHTARTGSSYLTSTIDGVDYEFRFSGHTTSSYFDVSEDDNGVRVSTTSNGKIDGVSVDLSLNDYTADGLKKLIEEVAEYNGREEHSLKDYEDFETLDEMGVLAPALYRLKMGHGYEREKAWRERMRNSNAPRIENDMLYRFIGEEGLAELERLERLVKDYGVRDYDLYLRKSGETEARNVQSRIGMSAEERRSSLASETEDVAREDQIFLESSLEDAAQRNERNKTLDRNGEGAVSDDRVAYENDPISKWLGELRGTKASRRRFAARERARARLAAERLAEKLHLTNVEILDDGSTLEGRRAKAKGFFSPRTGKITIIIGNHSGAMDVMRTVLHEGVAHYGLRKLFGTHFDTFLDNVYESADEEIKRKIAASAPKYAHNFRSATEEYLASLAEGINYETDNVTPGWWWKIKEAFYGMLRKLGFPGFNDMTLTDNELRYLLWRSYKNLEYPGGYHNLFREAEDIVMQQELKVGNYGETLEDTRAADSDPDLSVIRKRYDNGQQESEARLRNGIPDGLQRRWYENGVPMSESRFANGQLHGKQTSWHTNGQKFLEEQYEYGKPVGTWRVWHTDGTLQSEEQYEEPIGEELETDDALFREGDPEVHERALARVRYEQRLRLGAYQTQEALQDSMLSLREAMAAILGKKNLNVEDVEGFENAYLGENRLSSVNKAEADAFAHLLFRPLLDAVAKLAPTSGARQDLTDYMFAKHGLERNVVMAQRDAEAEFKQYEEEYPKGQKTLDDFIGKHRSRDYAGLTALTEESDVTEAEAVAEAMVAEYERNHDTADLWKRVNAVTKATLSKSYECGLMDKETFDKISGMYEYYIPLRGFDEKTSAEAYAYLDHKQSAFNAPIKHAWGRKSKADDPLAYMQSMAESTIMQGNRNKLVKQRFMNFVLNHPSDLVSVSNLWLQYNEVADEWEPVFPDNIEEGDSGETVEQKLQDFEEKMTQLSEDEPDRYKKAHEGARVPYRVVTKPDLRQHQVIVKRNGRDYVLTVNGNPRLAQAINGQTNPDNSVGFLQPIMKAGENLNRQLSAFYTTRNPNFVLSNFLRDMLYTNTMVWVKESPQYAVRFHRNVALVNPIYLGHLLNKYRNGQLDMSNRTEGLFYQFMMNGGETGYANIRDIERHKSDINRELKKAGNKISVRKAWTLLGERWDEVNRSIENCARFAAFVTSREMGRSMDRSIFDAKEISVNFNKKGSGAKFLNANGQTTAGNASAFVSGLGRAGFVFWNAAIQGTTNFGRQAKRHPAKAFAGVAAMFILGALIAALGAGDDDGDDDDKNKYYDLPEYIRRTNIVFKAGDYWVSIPLPVEYRAIYGMGELMASTISGKERKSGVELGEAIVKQMTQVLPLDFLEGGGGFNAFIPSSVKPFVEAYVTKTSWTGLPIDKSSDYNKHKPEWTKAYSNANKQLVELSALLNEASGGDAHKKGWIDRSFFGVPLNNPAKLEYVLNGYFGGVSSTINQLTKTAETVLGDREYDPRNIPLWNRVVKTGGEQTEYRSTNEKYYQLKELHDETSQLLRDYEHDTDNGIFNYAEKINLIYNSLEYEISEIFSDYDADIQALREELKDVSDKKERKEIEAEINELKRQLIDEVDALRKSREK